MMRARTLLLAMTVASLAGCRCRRGEPAVPDPAVGATPATGATATTGFKVEGLRASGVGPQLSWRPVAGAREYLVTVRGDHTWMWMGADTEVIYGVAETTGDYLVPIDSDAPIQLIIPEPGKPYRWEVSAFDAKGEALAVSDTAEFTYQPPAGEAKLPPRRRPAYLPAVFSCAQLVPEAMRQKLFDGWELDESSPCGGTPSVGCPWSCTFTIGDRAERRRVELDYFCREGVEQVWRKNPLKEGRPVAGLGREAARGPKGESVTLRFLDGDAPCIVDLRAKNVPDDRMLEIARAAEAALTADAVGLAR